MNDLRELLEQEQRKLDLLKRLKQIHDEFRKQLNSAVNESGIDPATLPFSLDGAGLAGIIFKDTAAGPYAGSSIPEAARKFLQDHPNKAATTPEIAEALVRGGIKTGSKNFTATVYTILQQTSKWFKRKGKLWILVEGR